MSNICRRTSRQKIGYIDKPFDHERLEDKENNTNQRLEDLRNEARQPRLTTEIDVKPDTKDCKRTMGATAADQAKHGGSSSARVDDDPTRLASFGMIAESRLTTPEKCIGDALVNKGTEGPKPHFPPVEVRMLSSVADGLMPAGTASTSTMTAIFSPPLFSWSLSKETKERTGRTKLNQLAPLCWRKVIQTKSRQTLVFDPGGCSGRLRGCPFLRRQRALLRGGFV